MYDYREDVINLMNHTESTKQSLDQSLIALDLLIKVYRDQRPGESEEEIRNLLEASAKPDIIEQKNASRKSSDVPNLKNDKEEINGEKSKNESDPYKVKIVEKNHSFEGLKEDEYRIVRKMVGAVAIDGSNNQIAYFREQTVREFDLQNHDIVQLARSDNDTVGEPYIVKVHHDPEPDNLVEFGPAVIEKNMFGLIVQSDINKKPLSSANLSHTFYTIPFEYVQKLHLVVGDIVTLVWDKDAPDNIKIRWLYRNASVSMNSDASAPVKKSTKIKDKKTQDISKDDDYEPSLDFDLRGQTVALLVADDSIVNNLNKVVEAHNGVPSVIELKSASIAKEKTQAYDIVILMQSYIKHSVSQAAIEQAKLDGTKIAMAQYAGQLSLEKALYRADNRLNVAEGPNVDYPLLQPALPVSQ